MSGPSPGNGATLKARSSCCVCAGVGPELSGRERAPQRLGVSSAHRATAMAYEREERGDGPKRGMA
jgi:hypothetical protein